MGKTLDLLFIGSALFLCVLLVLTFSGVATQPAALIALAAGISGTVLAERLMARRPRLSGRVRRRSADAFLKKTIYEDAARAHEAVFTLLEKRYPLADPSFEGGCLRFTHMREPSLLCVLQKLRASPDDLLALWRKFGAKSNVRTMVIAVPGKADADIRVQTLKLHAPETVLLDRAQLKRLARRYGSIEAPERHTRAARPFQALRSLLSRRRAWRYALESTFLILYYLFTGTWFYLLFGLALLFIALICLPASEEPEKLI